MSIRRNLKTIKTNEYSYDTEYFWINVQDGNIVHCNFYEYPVEDYHQILELLSYVQAVVAKRSVEGTTMIGNKKFYFKTVTKHEKKVQGKDITEWSLRCIFDDKETYLDYRQCYIVVVCLQKCLQFFTARPVIKK